MIKFIKHFILNPIEVGSVIPSSRSLAKVITETADLSHKRCVVEFGPGTGVFTCEITKRVPADAVSFAIEINEDFVKEIHRKCPEALVYHASAQTVQKILSDYNVKKCDCIISSLPWTGFSESLQSELMDISFDILNPGGIFLTFEYVYNQFLPGGRRYDKILKNRFSSVKKTKVVWKNFPPAFVYSCEK